MPRVLTAPAPTSPDAVADRIIDAALAEFTEHGLRRVKVDDIARRAGVHRVTVYKRFAGKDAVVIAAMLRWAQRYFTGIAERVADLPAAEALVEGFVLAMKTIRRDPLVARLLDTDAETALPYLTVNGAPALALVRSFFAGQLSTEPSADLLGAAEVAARLGLSFVLTPDSYFSFRTEDDIRAFARKFLVPLLPQ